jgi:hypothetical protein
VRWRALGQRLLRRGAIWVRDGADRVLIRLRARDASSDEAPNREPLTAVPNGAERVVRDRPTSVPPGGDGVPEHWRARVHTAAPRHWLERVEAARRRVQTIWIDAVARPKVRSSLQSSEESSPLEFPDRPPRSYQGSEESAPPDRPRHRPRSNEDPDASPSLESPRRRPPSYEGLVFEPASGRPKAAREKEPPAGPPHRPTVEAGRDSADHRSRPGSRPIAEAPPQGPASTPSAPAVRGAEPRPRDERLSSAPLEPDHEPGTHPRPRSLTPGEYPWSTPPSGDNVWSPGNRQDERQDNTIAAGPTPVDRALRLGPPVTSMGAGDLDWTSVVAPVRAYGDDRGESPDPARPGSGTNDDRSGPESTRAWPPFLAPDSWQRSTAPGSGSDVVAAARAGAASDEDFFYTNESADRWPALPGTPSAADEDWPAMRNRLERLDRLDREQRGW